VDCEKLPEEKYVRAVFLVDLVDGKREPVVRWAHSEKKDIKKDFINRDSIISPKDLTTHHELVSEMVDKHELVREMVDKLPGKDELLSG
jgi:hypothetical protein